MFGKILVFTFGIMAWNYSSAIDAGSGELQERFFNTDKLMVKDLNAILTVHVKAQDGVLIAMKGSKQLIENIEFSVHDRTLQVRQRKPQPLGNISAITIGDDQGNAHSVVSINGQTIVARGSGVTVVEHVPQKRLLIDIAVPEGTSMSFMGLKGSAEIGDVRGPLLLTTSGDIRIGHVAAATVDVSRSGDVYIEHVAKQLELTVSGNGEAKVAGGNVDHLNVSVTNNGEVEFNGIANNAFLSATDNGDLKVAHVVNRPDVHISRNADINVGNWKH